MPINPVSTPSKSRLTGTEIDFNTIRQIFTRNSGFMKVEFKAEIDNEKYGGKYIVLLDNETIVGSGEDVKKIWEEAKKTHPNRKISLMKVMKPGLYVLIACK